MIRQLPIIPTILVVVAAATMVALGVWQLGRAEEKAALIARYSESTTFSEPVDFPVSGEGEDVWYRRSSVECVSTSEIQSIAGTAVNGAKGVKMRAVCSAPGGGTATVDLGFSQDIAAPEWAGGVVTGIIAPGPRLVADPPVAGLYPLAKPDPKDLPNNHLAYAGQWFFFALTALVIYFLAVRSKLARRN